jgi:hypothetical protein
VEEEDCSNLVKHDAAPYVDLVVANMLSQGIWVLIARNPAILVAYNTMCVENGLIRKKNFLEITVIYRELFLHESYKVYPMELIARLDVLQKLQFVHMFVGHF